MTIVRSIPELIDHIGAGNPNPHHKGPVVIELKCVLADAQFGVTATYYKGKQQPHIDTRAAVIADDDLLRPLVAGLVLNATPIVIRQGSSDMTCTLLWQRVPLSKLSANTL